MHQMKLLFISRDVRIIVKDIFGCAKKDESRFVKIVKKMWFRMCKLLKA